MPTRLSLVCHGRTAAQRRGRFASADEPLEDGQEAALAALRARLKTPTRVLCAPELRTRQTAAAWDAPLEVLPVLRDCDHGAWTGRDLDQLQAEAPQALAAWLGDPAAAPHGGESQVELCQRLGAWLDAFDADGHFVVVSHPALLRAAVLHVLRADPAAFNAVDAAPLSVLQLTRNGRWRLRL
ncbi:histidine phosphatase family protein [Pseudomonas citronellolis]|uniref:histidine phosphatase family protein n=1 Tax=Pseudomonas citronellolis TaxID=53408 RepID=UPI0023E41C20|nr:histidine phosphatase family protein [Pseudomonas citronellolis]MDF3931220.1 histidine phosphatase family protein [Pseudomonas citronellolis]